MMAAPADVLLPFAALLGLLTGSFLNVVVHRVPAGVSIVSPGSACPHCQHPVRSRDNIPVVSWLLLRGRCRDCGGGIAGRYPLVELATAGLFTLAAWRFGITVYTGAALVLLAAGVALFLIDLEHQRLPFSITGVAAAGTVVALAIHAAINGGGVLAVAGLSAALWLGVYGGVWLLTGGRGMGLGDVALAPVLGLSLGWLGWGASVVGLAGGFLIGAVVGLVLLASGRATRGVRIAHGPFLLSGSALGMFVGDPLWRGYLQLVGLA